MCFDLEPGLPRENSFKEEQQTVLSQVPSSTTGFTLAESYKKLQEIEEGG